MTVISEVCFVSPYIGFETYVIAVGNNLNYSEVQAIATNPGPASDHLIPVADYAAMDGIIDQLVAATCSASGELDLSLTNTELSTVEATGWPEFIVTISLSSVVL